MAAVIHGDKGREFENKGREFENNLIQELCLLCGAHKTRTTRYHPASDGLVEHFNRTLLMMLAMFAGENRGDWDDVLPAVMIVPVFTSLPVLAHIVSCSARNLHCLWASQSVVRDGPARGETEYKVVLCLWCSGEARILCDLTIVSGRARFSGLVSSGRSPYGVI